jgi:hypothetical protein
MDPKKEESTAGGKGNQDIVFTEAMLDQVTEDRFADIVTKTVGEKGHDRVVASLMKSLLRSTIRSTLRSPQRSSSD